MFAIDTGRCIFQTLGFRMLIGIANTSSKIGVGFV